MSAAATPERESPAESSDAPPQPADSAAVVDEFPLSARPDEEWANALTHGLSALATVGLGAWLCSMAYPLGLALAIACGAYTLSVFATFFCSTLSHVVNRQPLLNQLRAWDQAMIYAMIAGTYTPIIYRFAPESFRMTLLAAVWLLAGFGIAAKLLLKHRINNVATITYLILGWLPAVPMCPYVPTGLGLFCLLGGIVYSLGVIVLVNDHRAPYLHSLWHVIVMSAAVCHFYGIQLYVLA